MGRALRPPTSMPKVTRTEKGLELRLYVAGGAPNSVSAIARAKVICGTHFAAGYKLEIVDMLKYPLRAMADGIIVTPTLLRLSPLPVRRVVGNLSDTAQVLLTLVNK
jgi:circadian clock protein KaiB